MKRSGSEHLSVRSAAIPQKAVEVAGHQLPKGARVMMLCASANRDEAVFLRADQFDIERRNGCRHLAFCAEIHMCAIASLPENVDHWIQVDFLDMEAVSAACAQLHGTFDVLIKNAGLPPCPDNQIQLLRVNAFGLHQVTEQVLSKLPHGARIVNLASRF